MDFDHTVGLVNEAGETRQRSYGDGSSLEDLCGDAVLEVVAETGDTSWEVDSVVSEPAMTREEILA